MRYFFVLIQALTFAACMQVSGTPPAAEVTGAGEVAFTMAGAGGAAIVVPVQINGQGPYKLVLDTGATFTCLDKSVVEQLDLPKARGLVGRGATIGGSGAIALHSIETLAVGDTTAKDLTVCALDLQGVNDLGLDVAGLLGLNFLKSFKVSIDFTRNVLSLTQP